MAKRKDYGEIILVITSQPKTKDKKKKGGKKSEKEKLFVDLDGEKKKRGFFFRKKSKSKVAATSFVSLESAVVCALIFPNHVNGFVTCALLLAGEGAEAAALLGGGSVHHSGV